MAVIDTPIPLTWASSQLITAQMLNTEIRDALRFIVSGCACTVALTANQSIATGVATTVVWDTQLDDVDGIITVPSGTFTFTRDGIISVRVWVTFAGSATLNRRLVTIVLNGSIISGADDGGSSNAHSIALNAAVDIPVVAGDTMIIQVTQNTGGALNLTGGLTGATVDWVGKVEDFTDFDAPVPDTPDPSKPPDANPTKHVHTYGAQWSRTYDGNNSTTWDDSKYCYQGRYDSNRNNTRSLVGFDWRSIKSDLNGATRISITLSYYVAHSYSFGGVTTIIGGHSYDNKPGSWGSGSVDNNLMRAHAALHRSRTVSLNSKLIKGFKSGKYKGIAFGPGPSTSRIYYAYYNGANMSSEPKLVVTYWK